MIYLDYAANTPVHEDVLDLFCELNRRFIANPNAAHGLGSESRDYINSCSDHILKLLKLNNRQLIFTSGATEANNLAIKGVAHQYINRGRHIISTHLEHSSVNGPLAALFNEGFEIDYLETDPDGLVSLKHLRELLRSDTVLVAVCYVDSEAGVTQQIGEIAELLSGYPNCRLHVDATQAVGKTALQLDSVDLITFTPHKFYGLIGSGVLIIKNDLQLEIQMHGGLSTTPFRSGTPALALAAATEKALELVLTDFDSKLSYVSELNMKLQDELLKYPKVRINNTAYSVPHILNISIPGVNTEAFRAELEKDEIYLSTRSACCAPNTVSRPIYAITKDRKRALSTLRISLSPLTTKAEIDALLESFDACYKKMGV